MASTRFVTLGLCVGIVSAFLAASCGSTQDDGELRAGTNNGNGDPNNPGGNTDPGSSCDAQVCSAGGGKCQGNVCVLTENPGNVSSDVQNSLKGGGSADTSFKWLYPYDQTVFPRGLISPSLQFDGSADSVYVHVTSNNLDYSGFFSGSNPLRTKISAPMWKAITLTAGAKTSLKVDVTKISSGQVAGPITETWRIAQGSLAGTIYHETYNSDLIGGAPMATLGGSMASGVGIMKFEPGKSTAPTIVKSGCANVCHAASADGSTLVASERFLKQGSDATNPDFTSSSVVYDLKANAASIQKSDVQTFTYGALTPDGSLMMSATDYRSWSQYASTSGMEVARSKLYDTKTGQPVIANGWSYRRGGTMAFSPDGKHFAFGDNSSATDPIKVTKPAPPPAGSDAIALGVYAAALGAYTAAMGNLLAVSGNVNQNIVVMDFDQPTKTFSNPRTLVKSSNKDHIGWPAFTPDSKSILYYFGTSSPLPGLGAAVATNDAALESDGPSSKGDIYAVDVATQKAVRLDALNGYNASGSYLPANDPNLNFSPTMLPVAVGGYFWVVFTSHRSYGNTLESKADKNEHGQLWVAAIDINAPAGKDASHPAFYLDGQELKANNLRGYWVLSPCKGEGQACGQGDECCGGFCRGADGAPKCVPPPPSCSNEYEKCGQASDCCDSHSDCINSHCAQIPVIR